MEQGPEPEAKDMTSEAIIGGVKADPEAKAVSGERKKDLKKPKK